jgi:hypothetical protein
MTCALASVFIARGLSAIVNVNMLHRDFLLPLPAMTIERIEQHRIGPAELVRLGQVFVSPLKSLLPEHPSPVTFD